MSLAWIFCVVLVLTGTAGDTYYDSEPIIGNAIDIFANYGDLSQVSQVISSDYDERAPVWDERSIRVFREPAALHLTPAHPLPRTPRLDNSLTFLFCDTFDALLDAYYGQFVIEGTDKPWKAFMGDWTHEEILRSLGIPYDDSIGMDGYCCFVFTRLSKVHRKVSLEGMDGNFTVTEQIQKAVDGMNEDDPADIRRFMTSYGTHYIDSYTTGNSVYQVFVYEEHAYRLLKRRMRRRHGGGAGRAQLSPHDLRFYTSSYFLRQIGEVMVASGNRTVEEWTDANLRDGQYLFSRPTLLRLYNRPSLLRRLDGVLDAGALLQLRLRIMAPAFGGGGGAKRDKYVETVDNDMKLWEVTG